MLLVHSYISILDTILRWRINSQCLATTLSLLVYDSRSDWGLRLHFENIAQTANFWFVKLREQVLDDFWAAAEDTVCSPSSSRWTSKVRCHRFYTHLLLIQICSIAGLDAIRGSALPLWYFYGRAAFLDRQRLLQINLSLLKFNIKARNIFQFALLHEQCCIFYFSSARLSCIFLKIFESWSAPIHAWFSPSIGVDYLVLHLFGFVWTGVICSIMILLLHSSSFIFIIFLRPVDLCTNNCSQSKD